MKPHLLMRRKAGKSAQNTHAVTSTTAYLKTATSRYVTFIPRTSLDTLPRAHRIISITDSYDAPPNLSRFSDVFHMLIRVTADDCFLNNSITPEHIKALHAFITADDTTPIAVQCTEGRCRSPAVAMFIESTYGIPMLCNRSSSMYDRGVLNTLIRHYDDHVKGQ